MLIEKSDRIFITGHKGMVGSSILRSFKKKGYKNLVTIERSELDLKDERSVKYWFNHNKPDIVISRPKISASLLTVKLINKFALFLISI